MEFEITEVTLAERPALANLVKMYCYEWSQYNLMDVDDRGIYPFEQYLDLYFTRPHRCGYLLKANGILAGFVLLDDDFAYDKTSDYAFGEFFVMYKYRRCGAGSFMAKTMFDRFPGKWEVGFHPKNTPSVKFWPRVIGEYTSGKYILHTECKGLTYNDGTLGSVITFNNSIV